ncbi:hypothetical protein [Antiquaquibacter soli]|uniref:DUF308 domain-containing protein n=1 Tax=Antiquaquibacter soli TaxID=3064523 RepID=A0ABT9BLI9_9MICO|nr:hypothetical protein [Protaetiibacter sp. WY-16]MDO7881893.1 hypothetical protein [Protaetiibacter sp. WY-16]
MAALSRSRRATAGIAFIVAGAALLLAALLPFVGVSVPWLYPIAYAAITVGLVILALGAVTSAVTKVALFAGALGWAILVLTNVGIAVPGVVGTIGIVLAALGTLVGAIVLYTGREIVNRSAIAFVVTAIIAALFLLSRAGLFSLGQFGEIVTIALGAGFLITGVLFRQTERKR